MTDKELLKFNFIGTPVTLEASGLLAPLNLFWLAVVLTAGQPWGRRLRYGLFAALNYVLADAAHFGGHIISSKMANGPMQAIRLAAPMPQSIYTDHDVSPNTHRGRAIGGPVGSAVAALVVLVLRAFTHPHTAARDFFNVAALGNGLLSLGSLLLPLPMVDGGVLLKWTLVEEGDQTPAAADAVVERANLAAGGVLAVAGSVMAIRKNILPGLMLLGTAAGAIAVGLGKFRATN